MAIFERTLYEVVRHMDRRSAADAAFEEKKLKRETFRDRSDIHKVVHVVRYHRPWRFEDIVVYHTEPTMYPDPDFDW